MKLEQIAKLLQDRKISIVSERLGICEATLRAIARGDNKNPTYAVYSKLVEYFKGENK